MKYASFFKYFILFLIFLIIYLFATNFFVKTTKYQIINKNIPNDFNNYKILQISDFHNNIYWNNNYYLINKIKKVKPDIIVITGDFIDAHQKNVKVSLTFAKNISNIAPVYYIPGNHEATDRKNYFYFKEKLKEFNINVIDGTFKTIKKGNSEINIIGLLEQSFYKDKKHINMNDIANDDLNSINYNKNNYSILLNHRPELFNTYVKNNIDLVFCGHAHGGQIRIPFIGGLYAPGQGWFPKYTSGIYKEKNTTMIVSRGVGNGTVRLRVNNIPELVLAELKSK